MQLKFIIAVDMLAPTPPTFARRRCQWPVEGDCTDVQGCLVRMRCAWAVGLQGLGNDTQEDAQHHAIALHEKTQPLWHQ